MSSNAENVLSAPVETTIESKYSVCLILIYFGSWPDWIDYFLRTCETNPATHWLIVTDQASPQRVPSNVTLLVLSQPGFEKLVSERIGYPYVLHHPYKLCDLKPAYGHVFEDELRGFGFWGYTDIDVVYGDLVWISRSACIARADVITSMRGFLPGHFTLFRNTPELNRLYTRVEGHIEAFMRCAYAKFDEGVFNDFVLSLSSSGQLTLFDSVPQLDDILLRYRGRRRWVVIWWKGRLFDLWGFKKLAYFHMLESKRMEEFIVFPLSSSNNAFAVSNFGIRPLISLADWTWMLREMWGSFVFTLPFYLKCLSKVLVGSRLRSCLRRLLSGSA